MNMIPAGVLLAINQAQQTQISNLSIHGLAAHNNLSRTVPDSTAATCKCLLYRYEFTIAPHVRFVFEFFTQKNILLLLQAAAAAAESKQHEVWIFSVGIFFLLSIFLCRFLFRGIIFFTSRSTL